MPGGNQVDAVDQATRSRLASRVLDAHRKGLQSRFQRDLLSEKLLLHIDGSGDFQWADIYYNQRVEIPRYVSEFRKTENVLRLVVDNAVAHHTTMPLRYFAESMPDRRSRERSMVDSIWVNAVAHEQDLNGLFADALYMAMATGFCPVHRYWRDEISDQHEPIEPGAEDETTDQLRQMFNVRGMIDCWVGNPFDTVFDRASKRGSIYSCSYGRMLPADLVRRAYDHVPGVAGLEGTNRVPSASVYQRIARKWQTEGLGIHGSATITYRQGFSDYQESGDELMNVICREVAPGVDADWPEGRLLLVAVPGAADLRRGEGGKHAVLLAQQKLPAADFSFTNFYSHHRSDDVHGKPWVEDIDQEQTELNIALSKRWEFVNRMIEAPIVVPGGAINEDMAEIDGYSMLEIEPSLAPWRPAVMTWPEAAIHALDREVEDRRKAIYTGGGYQASSRGEAPGSRMAYKAIVALQQADNSIHGPVNQRFRRSATDFARGMWKQMKRYGDVPWLIEFTGDEFSYLADPYVDAARLSERPPQYKFVNAFGASPELRAQEMIERMGTRGADGLPFLTTHEARRAYPNPFIFDEAGDPAAVQKRRAKTVATAFHHMAAKYREDTELVEVDLSHPWVQKAAMDIFYRMEAEFPRLRDDDLEAHLSTLSEVTQDETSDPIARLACMKRQDLYYQWQAQMAQQLAVQPVAAGTPGALTPDARSTLDPRQVAKEMGGGAESAATARG